MQIPAHVGMGEIHQPRNPVSRPPFSGLGGGVDICTPPNPLAPCRVSLTFYEMWCEHGVMFHITLNPRGILKW
jgi:hypothetical protein